MEVIDGGEIIEIKCPRWQTGCGASMINQYFARQIFSHKLLLSGIEEWAKEMQGNRE